MNLNRNCLTCGVGLLDDGTNFCHNDICREKAGETLSQVALVMTDIRNYVASLIELDRASNERDEEGYTSTPKYALKDEKEAWEKMLKSVAEFVDWVKL